jgi:UPF0755 protein
MKKIIWILLFTGLAIGGYFAYGYYNKTWKGNIEISGEGAYFLYIPTGATEKDVAGILTEAGIMKDKESFLWLAEQKNYNEKNVVPGKYEIRDNWSNNELINHLRAGRGRLEVTVTFNNVRTLEQIAGKVAKYIEADSAELIETFTNPDTIRKYGFNEYTFVTLFIPNTYKMDWATSSGEFLQIITRNYKQFWNEDRKKKASQLGLTQSEITILASIVQAEQTRHAEERPKIAGLYINRLNKGIRLQSDPTVIFAVGDYSIRRVLNKHLECNSPYNTYMHGGLPPGPINVPEISSIDAVLNYEKSDFIYMCAKPGYDGYHNFSKSLSQHEEYARIYRSWLDKEGIKR